MENFSCKSQTAGKYFTYVDIVASCKYVQNRITVREGMVTPGEVANKVVTWKVVKEEKKERKDVRGVRSLEDTE